MQEWRASSASLLNGEVLLTPWRDERPCKLFSSLCNSISLFISLNTAVNISTRNTEVLILLSRNILEQLGSFQWRGSKLLITLLNHSLLHTFWYSSNIAWTNISFIHSSQTEELHLCCIYVLKSPLNAQPWSPWSPITWPKKKNPTYQSVVYFLLPKELKALLQHHTTEVTVIHFWIFVVL